MNTTICSSTITALLILAPIFTGCNNKETEAIPRYEHVIVLGFDGFAGAALDSTDNMPFLKSMMAKSAWTSKKRSVIPTVSACNWASMFMGVGPEGTGYTKWDSRESVFTPSETGPGGIFPTVFTLLKQAHPEAETGCGWQWDGIKYIVDSAAVNLLKGFNPKAEGIDEMAEFAASYIKEEKPALCLFAWDYPDHTGHSLGWYSKDYYDMLGILDGAIEKIVRAVEEEPDIADKTLIIISSDHGGHDFTHGSEIDVDLFSPLVIYGSKVKQCELSQPVYQYDIAATIAAALGLSTPSSWRGRPVTEAFE